MSSGSHFTAASPLIPMDSSYAAAATADSALPPSPLTPGGVIPACHIATGMLSIVLQIVLIFTGCLALFIKWRREDEGPEAPRRTVRVWLMDCSKQLCEGAVGHFLNLGLAYALSRAQTNSDGCAWCVCESTAMAVRPGRMRAPPPYHTLARVSLSLPPRRLTPPPSHCTSPHLTGIRSITSSI